MASWGSGGIILSLSCRVHLHTVSVKLSLRRPPPDTFKLIVLGIDDVRTFVNRMHGDIVDRIMPMLKSNIRAFSRRMIQLVLPQLANRSSRLLLLDNCGENSIAS